ncbi:MAG: YeeE/YedE thiosulfate transporter family protein [Planctomycetaceae bacterium]
MKRAIAIVVAASSACPGLASAQDVHDLTAPYPYPEPAWSPYLVGALIGVLMMITLIVSKKPIGASSAYSELAGIIGRIIAPRHIASLKYYQEHKPAIGWSLLFVVGIIGGGFIAATTGGEITGYYLQEMWVARFGSDSHLLRTVTVFVGGAVMAYGARMAGGCTSGHGISGTLQLAVGSWIAVICFFVGGIATAMLMYRW